MIRKPQLWKTVQISWNTWLLWLSYCDLHLHSVSSVKQGIVLLWTPRQLSTLLPLLLDERLVSRGGRVSSYADGHAACCREMADSSHHAALSCLSTWPLQAAKPPTKHFPQQHQNFSIWVTEHDSDEEPLKERWTLKRRRTPGRKMSPWKEDEPLKGRRENTELVNLLYTMQETNMPERQWISLNPKSCTWRWRITAATQSTTSLAL